jgi:UDP-N-acetylglucosamine enolpyruvyl transferase
MLARYGMGTLCDTVFPKRRSFLAPYHALGANFAQLDDGTISFSPADAPRADCISVPDLRTGAGAVLYALSLDNDITVYDTQDFILRGYEHFTKKLNALGACMCDETHINRKE